MRTSPLKLIAVLLVLATLFGSIPAFELPILAADTPSETPTVESLPLVVTRDGEAITELTLADDEKVVLTATTNQTERSTPKFQWQILDPNSDDRYLDIHGATARTLSVSYALIGSMLTPDGKATLRCTLDCGSVQYVSAEIAVTVSYHIGKEAFMETPMKAPLLSASSGEELATHSIVINYLFDNNAIAFEPYGATVAKGSDFHMTIKSPEVVGYAPFRRVGEDYVDATEVTLSYDNIQEDIVINVIYEPALVEFSVHHHLQNLLDDDYSVHYDLITTGYALTGSTVGSNLALTEAELPGFKALAYERLTVAADGSTVVEIRYDRNYYLIDFDMNGGFGSEPIYTRYGMTVGVNDPIRHGYVFDGWELVSYGGNTPTAEQASQYDINTANIIVPDANLTYRARWITQETTYTMVFWRENANDDGYSYWGYLDNLAAMSGSYVSGSDRIDEVDGIEDSEYFTFNPSRTDTDILVEGDGSTVVNVYYTRNRYTLTIKATGKCVIPTGHTHADACYTEICGKGHQHTEDCHPTLICTTEEHPAHTDSCVICGKEAHTHTAACCGLSEHTHTSACWNNISTAQSNRPSGAPTNPADGQIYRRSWNYYIYIKGTWYRYDSWGASSGDIVDPACGYSTEHTHGSSDCTCSLTEHIHADSCYRDVLHAHGETCYRYSCGDIAHIHTDDCYLLHCAIPTGHTHSSTCNNANSTNTVKLVYRKYQESLEEIWPITDDNGTTYDSGERWDPSNSSLYSEVLVYIANMPGENFTLTLNKSNANTFKMHYYLEVLPGTTGDDLVPYDGKTFKLYTTVSANYNHITRDEDFFNITGFDQYASSPAFSGTQISYSATTNGNVYFYYSRVVDHVLQFNNNGIVMLNKDVSGIMYGAPLTSYNFTPDYPQNLEPNAFTFAGWYTSPGCFDGTEVDWDNLTMPEGDLMLYAKWEPIKHTVKIFLDATLSEQIGKTQYIPHNDLATAPEETVENGNYIFQGWFYSEVEDGETVEKAFVFTGIPVTQDLNIYAKWSSHVSVNYTIHYVLRGTDQKIADSTTGTAIAGHNKTFYAKAGDELYAGYTGGYYPLTNSHTITMSVDGVHEFTFEYVYVESMPYAVRYLGPDGETVVSEKKVLDNTHSVVTETFVRVDKMMPDAYQKRLVLTASGEDSDNDGIFDSNVITFHYASDEEHAYYRVIHYIQNISGDGYREYRSVDTVGEIGKAYTVDALTLTGFAFNGTLTMINGVNTPTSGNSITETLGAEGMLIEFYYQRESYSYTVKYLENGTNREIAPQKSGNGMFGEQIIEYAKDLSVNGYTLASSDTKTLAISANAAHNIFEFYYTETTVSLKYEIVGAPNSGTLTQQSENLAAISGTPLGSQPIAMAGYHFVGWFTDTACTTPVDSTWVDSTMHLIPQKAQDAIWTNGLTFYALFYPDHTSFTIRTTGCEAIDSDSAYLFRLTGVSSSVSESISLTVTVVGNGSVTITNLPVGTYTVAEITDWSWRYDPDSASRSVTLTVDHDTNEVTFDHEKNNAKWLDGNSVKQHSFSSNP
ncbi:MAG: InlB B-repeat-containing protein [Clostridia bacterium]|nr:InlB B-repeat-containing protein [Clostridia bacterium]